MRLSAATLVSVSSVEEGENEEGAAAVAFSYMAHLTSSRGGGRGWPPARRAPPQRPHSTGVQRSFEHKNFSSFVCQLNTYALHEALMRQDELLVFIDKQNMLKFRKKKFCF